MQSRSVPITTYKTKTSRNKTYLHCVDCERFRLAIRGARCTGLSSRRSNAIAIIHTRRVECRGAVSFGSGDYL